MFSLILERLRRLEEMLSRDALWNLFTKNKAAGKHTRSALAYLERKLERGRLEPIDYWQLISLSDEFDDTEAHPMDKYYLSFLEDFAKTDYDTTFHVIKRALEKGIDWFGESSNRTFGLSWELKDGIWYYRHGSDPKKELTPEELSEQMKDPNKRINFIRKMTQIPRMKYIVAALILHKIQRS